MSGGHARELFEDLRSGLGTALESMLGQAPAISVDPLPAAPDETTLRWRPPMGSPPGASWGPAG